LAGNNDPAHKAKLAMDSARNITEERQTPKFDVDFLARAVNSATFQVGR
jgi:hypothetical protein